MKISQMPQSTTPSSDDVLAMLEGGSANKKVTFGTFADWATNEYESPDLNTDEKTIVGALNEHEADIVEISEDLENTKLTGGIVANASGSVISISDSAGALLPVEMKLHLTPHQNLNGYDHPWVGGAGKNLFKTGYTTQVINGVTFTVNDDGSITITGTPTQNAYYNTSWPNNPRFYLEAGTYYISGGNSVVELYVVTSVDDSIDKMTPSPHDIGSGATFVLEEGSYCQIRMLVKSGKTPNEHIYPMLSVQQGATWEPYENICPITGYDAVKVIRTGKNIIDLPTITLNKDTHRVHTLRFTDYAFKAGVYTVSFDVTSNTCDKTSTFSIRNYSQTTGGAPDLGRIDVAAKATGHYQKTFTMPIDFDYFYVFEANSSASGSVVEFENIQIEYADSETAYEPYDGEVYNITIPTEAGTVYGGTVDMRTGELSVDRIIVDIASLTWQTRYTGTYNKAISSNLAVAYPINKEDYSFITERYAYQTDVASINAIKEPDTKGIGIYSYYPGANTNRTAIYLVIGVDDVPAGNLCYKIGTPITYQLTPSEITLLKDHNTIWMSADGTIDLEYSVDIKTYIDNKIAELQALVLENNG